MKYIGVVLSIAAILVLIAYGLYELISDLLIPMVIKLSIIALIVGIIIILGALIIEKIKERRGK